MRNDRLTELNQGLKKIVGKKNLLIGEKATKSYRQGIRVGEGKANCVVLPKDLIEFWEVLKLCISLDKIIIIQAANTGLTGGSTPDGDKYDRDVVIINTLRLDRIIILNNGLQVLAFPGATLFELEETLSNYNREPHSLIGSSCIGASIVGGICNNSGGNLVNRGPAYTELSLFARVNSKGKLELINHLDIELGNTPEEILSNLENINFNQHDLQESKMKASDIEYSERIRDVKSSLPARYNSDRRRLYESSGCAGKVAVFAARLDTFVKPRKEQVFLIGTNDSKNFSELRNYVLTSFEDLPEMVEYMHKSFFDAASKYGKDTFLIIKYLGRGFIPKLFGIKKKIEVFFSSLNLDASNFVDNFLHDHAQLLPDHLPKIAREYRRLFDHILIIKAGDKCIEETREMLSFLESKNKEFDYHECLKVEGQDLLLHRYVAGIAPKRFMIINNNIPANLLPLDVALPRNCTDWDRIITDNNSTGILESFRMGHFLCMVFHWDLILSNTEDFDEQKKVILAKLDSLGAKYPAEHNVGHLYFAEYDLSNFYKKIDPTNSFNSGIGKLSKNKFYS
ncbi:MULTISPECIES: D-lactate dehydrogenase [Prochlorococcus]|uniref:D-lactate dehydrogenase n=1 Tax=Prochlorococcus TaxID=1218 RepID=UPI00053387A1|nr:MULTISPECIES: D-lactate dehydrogenase [Prochlorococcus]KGG12030.1 D-Lactate dehydrogenase [Prochlorococcus sp. MIT 0601]